VTASILARDDSDRLFAWARRGQVSSPVMIVLWERAFFLSLGLLLFVLFGIVRCHLLLGKAQQWAR